jgi:2,3-bisphosphoglycerate-independent phosphoglycerate mutase
MSAPGLTEKAVTAIASGKYDVIVLNYADPDMVGHTGDLSAAIKAVESVDVGLGRLVTTTRSIKGAMLVTADHGNCEMMRDPKTGKPHTAHTTNPVPVLLMGTGAVLRNGLLANVAPTLLEILGLRKPARNDRHIASATARHWQRLNELKGLMQALVESPASQVGNTRRSAPDRTSWRQT